jgi:glycerol dehydrogenase-like iron-containing ADH family enzyme
MFKPTEKEVELTEKIVLEMINSKIVIDSIELKSIAKKILSIVYSVGGGYTEDTIRQVARLKVKEFVGTR